MSDQIKYYFKEDTNQILVSGSSTKDGMNILLNSAKDENTIFTGPPNGNNTVLLSSLGQNSTYVIQNNGQEAGDTTIAIGADQELWLYRGWQPTGTGILDANAYRYNPHLHRPYKAYILTETGGGSSAFPWSPDGSTPFSNFPGGTTLQIPDVYEERYLASNGSQTQQGINSTAVVKGELTVTQAGRGIHPWIYTRYSSKQGTKQGSTFYLYKENTNYTYGSNYFTTLSEAVAAGQPNAVILNNATVTSITEVTLGSTYANTYVLSGLISNIAQGKPAGELVFTQSATANSTITGTITSVVFARQSGQNTYKVGLSDVTSPSSTVQYSNNSAVSVKFQDYPQYVGTPIFQQELASATNFTPALYSDITLSNALYTYTSSVFDGNSSGVLGFSEFGIYADLNWSVIYQATNDTGGTVRIYFTNASGVPRYYDLETGFIVEYSALTIPAPYFDPASPGTGFENIVFQPFTQAPSKPTSAYKTRVNDVYIAYSSSLSQSIDGLYVFNQIPQSDVQVTVSMFLDAWRGEDEGAKYGIDGVINTNTTYSLDPEPPFYGAGETGDGLTWTTASIRLYTGTYPNAVPTVLDDFLYEEVFESEIININGLPITASYLLPKADISLKTCLSVALQVSTGSNTPASDVENSLVVREYKLEFNTPGADDNDGSVPVMLDDAFSGGDSFKNSPDCQPLYNVYVTDETLRRNPLIQEVEYNIPESFFLLENQELIPFIYPNGAVSIDPITTVTYSQANNQIITSGNGTGIVLNLEVINNGGGIKITVTNPGSGYQNGDTLSISKAELRKTFTIQSMVRDLLINLNFVFGLYNPSNFRPILENTAIKSSVPESNYTQLSSITPKYLGARSTANDVNSINGLSGGFGTLPVIDYKTAFFAYCDQVLDPYPTINNKTLFNIKYLINEGGDPKQPNLSPYTAFDVEGSWEEGGQGRVGINQISGSNQYDALNNLQPIYKVAKQYVPIFWSQTGSDGWASSIPMSGRSFTDITDQFMQYGMQVYGNVYNSTDANSTLIQHDNFFDSGNGDGNFNNQTFALATDFGIYNGTPTPTPEDFVFSSASFVNSTLPNGAEFINTKALKGEMFFNTDQYAINGLNGLSGNQLSSNYTIETEFTFPASPPRSNYTTGEEAPQGAFNLDIRLEYIDQPYNSSIVPFPSDNYTIANAELEILGDVFLDLYLGNRDATYNTVPSEGTGVVIRTVNLSELLTTSEMSVGATNSFFYSTTPSNFGMILKFSTLGTYLDENGIEVNDINFVKFRIKLITIESLLANRRYRWNVKQTGQSLVFSNNPTAVLYQNRWNPTTVTSQQSNAGSTFDPPIRGPFINATIKGNKVITSENSIPLPNPGLEYWGFYVGGVLIPGAGPTPSGGTGYGTSLSSGPLEILSSWVDTPGASGGTINLTTDASGAIVSCTLAQTNSSGYVVGSIIIVPEAILKASSLAVGGSGTSTITLAASNVNIGNQENILEFLPITGNDIYSDGQNYSMGTLPYIPSNNPFFPGGQEPSDTAFPELGIPFQFQVGDELRFNNSEDVSNVFSITSIIPPSQGNGGNTRLRIVLDHNVPSSTNKNFFLFRRLVNSPNSIYVDRPFPYGTLPKTKRFVDSTNQSFGSTPAFTGASYPTQATSEGSGSFIEYTEPLRKSDNTPAGILFPEYPTALIDLTPDEILKNLRDNKLIE